MYRTRIAILYSLALTVITLGLHAQEKNLVQIKIFDQQMNAIESIGVSINGHDFMPITQTKASFHEILREDLPPKSVKVSKNDLEVESWNYTKGTLEIIVRKKQYSIINVTVETAAKKPVPHVAVIFSGSKVFNVVTGSNGEFQLPLALNEKSVSSEQFSIAGYRVRKIAGDQNSKTLTVEPVVQKKQPEIAATPSLFIDFDMNRLDSIRSLTVFYAVFKNFDMSSLEPDVRAKVDAKFNELIKNLQQSDTQQKFISRISDSSFVQNDVQNLLEQAKLENTLLDNFRGDFDAKLDIINQKLKGGTSNLKPTDREKLLDDLSMLESVLIQNEDKFYRNISDYRIILSSLRSSVSDIKVLEDKLTISEFKRLEEQQAFNRKIVLAVSAALVFGLLVIFLVVLSTRVQRQKKSLVIANLEVKTINENLEGLVFERSRQLVEAYQEMDIFLYRASHDLRAPICTIIGLCNLAVHMPDGDPELIRKISNTAIKMDGMLKKLRMISEVNHPNNYSPVLIRKKIGDIMRLFNRTIAENKVEVVIDSDESLSFYSYPDLIEIILYNLIENALFFSSMRKDIHPKIHIMASAERDQLFLSVYDNGIGIEEKIRIKLWDMFFVGNEMSKGNGLGLYIVLKTVQSLNGKIDLETEPNNFTRFSITIPVNTKVSSTLTRLGAPRELALTEN